MDSNNFEHLVNAIAIRVLGSGVTGFGPGADGGRDGFFEGKADYPSSAEQWNGIWYIQSKFHPPHLSADPQKWLLNQIQQEITSFKSPSSRRRVPDVWIIATNIEPSGVAETGCFDAARALVAKSLPPLANRFHIWGGRKILDFLASFPDISEYYGEFLTPGHILKKLYDEMSDSRADISEIFRYVTVTQMMEQQYTKLEQAGSTVDNRPGIQRLYTDIPFKWNEFRGLAAASLSKALAQVHRTHPSMPTDDSWKLWAETPSRARAWLVKGGPGQGKSTLTQYVAQIQRAALILGAPDLAITSSQAAVAEEIRSISTKQGLWPEAPRMPVTIELKDFAFWLGQRTPTQSPRVIAYLVDRFGRDLGTTVQPGTLKRAFATSRWLFVFDGLDEVPGDVKDAVANEVVHFVDDTLVACGTDAAIVCTSRPQGYSGQFASLGGATVELATLTPEQALKCATPLLKIGRSQTDSRGFIETLREALKSPAIAEIMTTPLQAHIMAVVVRDGGRPPERRWKLFNTFYEIIKKREANRNLPDKNLATLLREGDKLLRALHNRLGFELHARAETSEGATTAIRRDTLKLIVSETVTKLQDKDVKSTVSTLMKATTERLVLVNTPENGEFVRFDIRPLQEFFAAEFLYRDGKAEHFHSRLEAIAADAHWREVMHFLISALVENGRNNELLVATSVLESIDSGEGPSRAFNRRLAKGAKIAARLLVEGVLEEDKQIRSRFLNAIIPMAGQSFPSELLTRKPQRHSLAWLQDAMLTAIREQTPAETIGAAICLGRILPDKDKRSREVSNFIEGAGSSYVAYFLYALDQNKTDYTKLSRWVCAIAVRFLMSDKWLTFPSEVIAAASHIAASQIKTLRDELNLSHSSSLANVIGAALWSSSPTRRHRTTSLEVVYGIVEMHLEPVATELEYEKWPDEIWSNFKTLPGLFSALYHAFELLRTRSIESKENFLNSIGRSYSNFSLIPYPIKNFFRENLAYKQPGDSDEINLLIESHKPGWERYGMTFTQGDNIDVIGIAQEFPTLFFHLFNDEDYKDSFLKFSNHEAFPPALTKSITASASHDVIYTWRCLKAHPALNTTENCNLILTTACGPVIRHKYRNSLRPIKINLPAETVLLPHVVGMMMDAIETENKPAYLIKEHNRLSLHTWTEQFAPSASDLKKVFSDHKRPAHIRFAALALYHFHPKRDTMDNYELFVQLYDPAHSTWMLPAIAYALFDQIQRKDAKAISAFGTLLERSADDYFGRAALASPFKAWIESSGSPVTSSQMAWVD
ncbi:NACHT domain-containing NTPase [Rhizobium sp. BT03]|uniref:NACHT domain-containing protein n=1 Tax=Rhizobium sp. BT03 TaxID=3045156 RepID=UPI0024B3DE54|nr:hypothetical protein [Rhizobium sp. BT03]WHO75149.1 hypothetical protein QMO80_004243 [Rhizobium sp. BT03]